MSKQLPYNQEEITLNLNGFPANEFPNVPQIDDHAEISNRNKTID